MKRSLALSLFLNIVLLLLALHRSSHPRIPSRILRVEMSPFAPQTRVSREISGHRRLDTVNPWSAIETADPAMFIAKLRTLGCPENTIRDIIVLRLGRKYRNELIRQEAEAARSWDYTRPRRDGFERIQRQNELRDDMQTELERLLGKSWGTIAALTMGWPAPIDLYEFVSDERRQQLRELEREHARLKANLIRQQTKSEWVTPDNTALNALEQDYQANLAAFLSAQEMKEYLYRFSPAAKFVRDYLGTAGNESEFRTMVDVAQQYEIWKQPGTSFLQSYGFPDVSGADAVTTDNAVAAEYSARKTAFDQRLKEALGEDRVAQRQMEEQARAEAKRKQNEAAAQERERDQLAAVAESVGVAADVANRFFDRMVQLQPELQRKFEQLEKDLKGTEEEKAQAMNAAVTAELEHMAADFMGAKAHAFVEKLDK
jgi:hypothetical protein